MSWAEARLSAAPLTATRRRSLRSQQEVAGVGALYVGEVLALGGCAGTLVLRSTSVDNAAALDCRN